MPKYVLTLLFTVLLIPEMCLAAGGGVEKGMQLFEKYCVTCHGDDGSGSEHGKYLKTSPVRDLRTNSLFFSDSELVIVINHGAAWREMPNWEYVLSEEEAQNVAWYLRSIFEP